DHAEAERVRGARVLDRIFMVRHHDAAFVWPVVAHDALDQRGFAGAVFAEKCMEGSGRHLQRYVVERRELAEPLGHAQRFEPQRMMQVRRRRRADQPRGVGAHAIAPMKDLESETAPNTPPCILIILMAWSWLLLSVAPQQSSRSRHSKPRSLASRMVV